MKSKYFRDNILDFHDSTETGGFPTQKMNFRHVDILRALAG